ncbi:MAG TPA: EAL domain-containing protein [Bryobacteraceae bacterium]|nr:EAL domain-containing protein [Bryobacteraceae bacterium]
MANDQQKPANDQSHYRLLVVDDDPLNLDMLARRLSRLGYKVESAENGPRALDLIASGSFDLLLLDHNMPGMSGLEVLVTLRRSYSPLDLPIIIVTAVSDSQTTVDALNAGANDYVTKPVDFEVLLARMRSQLARREAQARLHEGEQRDVMAARGSNDGFWDWDLQSNAMYLSARWKEILGYDPDEIEDSAAEWLSRIHPDDSNRVQYDLDTAITGVVEQFNSEHRLQHKDGSWRWVRSRAQTVRDSSGQPTHLAGTLIDITDSKIADPITNLPNRALLLERLAEAITRSGRESGYTFAVLLLDIDRFKVINDSLGHLVGDELLVGIASRLRTLTHEGSILIARLGGDEFAILLGHPARAEQVDQMGTALRELLSQPFRLEGRDVFCTLSIGAALGPGDAIRVEDLLRDADTAMYRAKALGGARIEIFDRDMRKRAVARLDLETDLRAAFANDDYEVYYQPKVNLGDGRITGFEALARWLHPRLGLIYPDQFIPLAEETGLIIPLGNWVLEQACRQLKSWQQRFPQTPPLTMSVNMSCRQFRDAGLVGNVERILKENDLEPSTLRLEITESVFIEDAEEAGRILELLKNVGVGLKIDDFGKGYSSLSYLCNLPFDTVKIDRAFVSCLPQNGSHIVDTVIRLAGALGMNVVAEGVETREQVELLQSLGCKYAQGYYFSEPVEASQIENMLTRSAKALLPAIALPRNSELVGLSG